jgi:hypothetical protein
MTVFAALKKAFIGYLKEFGRCLVLDPCLRSEAQEERRYQRYHQDLIDEDRRMSVDGATTSSSALPE